MAQPVNGSPAKARKLSVVSPPGAILTLPHRYSLESLPRVSLPIALDCLNQEEYGDALLFAHVFEGRCVYDHTAKKWFLWQGHYWQEDKTKEIYHYVTGLLSSVYIRASADLNLQVKHADNESARELLGAGDEGEDESAQKRLRRQVNALQARARSLKMKSRMLNVLDLATSINALAITSDKWDSLKMVIGTAQGVIDLRTGELREGKPADYIRTIVPTPWAGLDAPAPRFVQFLHEIFDDRPERERSEIINFLQRALGAGITGTAKEHIFLLLFGEEGRNGKDTLTKALQDVMGETVGAISNEVLIASSKYTSPGAAKPHLVSLQGRRLAWASETSKGERFDVGQVKFLTGGGEIPARPLYGSEYKFKPTHLLLLLTNNKPHADANDRAFWERLCPITFNNRFVKAPSKPNERVADTSLNDKLEQEASGILAWLVQGALMWNKEGLVIPPSVLRERAKYREDEDTLGLFITEYCVIERLCEIRSSVLYQKYEKWCEDNNIKPMSGTSFSTEIGKVYKKHRKTDGVYYLGIGDKEDYPEVARAQELLREQEQEGQGQESEPAQEPAPQEPAPQEPAPQELAPNVRILPSGAREEIF